MFRNLFKINNTSSKTSQTSGSTESCGEQSVDIITAETSFDECALPDPHVVDNHEPNSEAENDGEEEDAVQNLETTISLGSSIRSLTTKNEMEAGDVLPDDYTPRHRPSEIIKIARVWIRVPPEFPIPLSALYPRSRASISAAAGSDKNPVAAREQYFTLHYSPNMPASAFRAAVFSKLLVSRVKLPHAHDTYILKDRKTTESSGNLTNTSGFICEFDLHSPLDDVELKKQDEIVSEGSPDSELPSPLCLQSETSVWNETVRLTTRDEIDREKGVIHHLEKLLIKPDSSIAIELRVCKVNLIGRKLPRILRITDKSIENWVEGNLTDKSDRDRNDFDPDEKIMSDEKREVDREKDKSSSKTSKDKDKDTNKKMTFNCRLSELIIATVESKVKQTFRLHYTFRSSQIFTLDTSPNCSNVMDVIDIVSLINKHIFVCRQYIVHHVTKKYKHDLLPDYQRFQNFSKVIMSPRKRDEQSSHVMVEAIPESPSNLQLKTTSSQPPSTPSSPIRSSSSPSTPSTPSSQPMLTLQPPTEQQEVALKSTCGTSSMDCVLEDDIFAAFDESFVPTFDSINSNGCSSYNASSSTSTGEEVMKCSGSPVVGPMLYDSHPNSANTSPKLAARAVPNISARQADQLDDYILKHAERSHKYTIAGELPDIGRIVQEEKDLSALNSPTNKVLKLPIELVKNIYYQLHIERFLFDDSTSEGKSIAKLFHDLKVSAQRSTLMSLEQLHLADQAFTAALDRTSKSDSHYIGGEKDVDVVFPGYISQTSSDALRKDATKTLDMIRNFIDALSAFMENTRLDELHNLPKFEDSALQSVSLTKLFSITPPTLQPKLCKSDSHASNSETGSDSQDEGGQSVVSIQSAMKQRIPLCAIGTSSTIGHNHTSSVSEIDSRSHEAVENLAVIPIVSHSSLPKTPLQSIITQTLQLLIISATKTRCNAAVVSLCNEKDILIAKQRTKLAGLPQSFFGIQEKDADDQGWRVAINILSHIELLCCPFERLQCLLETAQAIYTRSAVIFKNRAFLNKQDKAKATLSSTLQVSGYDAEQFIQEEVEEEVPPPLAADDFFPIFIYVVVNSEVRRLESVKVFINSLCDQNSLQGEGGYYLTVLEAAIEYIARFSMNEHRKREEREAKKRADKRARKEAARMKEMILTLESEMAPQNSPVTTENATDK